MHIRGQALNEQIYQYIIVLSGGLGFLYGAYMESFGYCVRAWFGGCCLACLVSGAAVRSRRAVWPPWRAATCSPRVSAAPVCGLLAAAVHTCCAAADLHPGVELLQPRPGAVAGSSGIRRRCRKESEVKVEEEQRQEDQVR